MFKIFIFYNKLLSQNFLNSYIFIIFLNLLSAMFILSGVFSTGLLVSLFVDNKNENFILFSYLQKVDLDYLKISTISYFILLFLIIGNVLSFCSLYYLRSFLQNFEIKLKEHVFKKFLDSPYIYKISKDRSSFANFWSTYISRITNGLQLYLNICTSFLIVFIYIFFIFLLDFKIFIFFLTCSLIIILIYFNVKKRLAKNSIIESNLNRVLGKLSFHINVAFRDIIFLGLKNKTINELRLNSIKKKKTILSNLILLSYPKFLLEILIITIFVIVANQYYITDQINSGIPHLTTIFLVIIKGLPNIINCYRSISELKSISNTLIEIAKNQNYLFRDIFKNKKFNSYRNKINSFKKDIVFNKVEFSYNKNKIFKFDKIKFIKKDWVHISGKSGSGKTTFFNLLFSNLIPNFGNVLIDGRETKFFSGDDLKFIGYVYQNNILFEGNLAWNITFKKILSKKDKIFLKLIYDICGLKNIVKSFRNIFKYKVNLDSPGISGGQKQRVALARTLFRNPDILILDESFNALDKKSENTILRKIKKNFPNITTFYASHRNTSKLFNKKINI